MNIILYSMSILSWDCTCQWDHSAFASHLSTEIDSGSQVFRLSTTRANSLHSDISSCLLPTSLDNWLANKARYYDNNSVSWQRIDCTYKTYLGCTSQHYPVQLYHRTHRQRTTLRWKQPHPAYCGETACSQWTTTCPAPDLGTPLSCGWVHICMWRGVFKRRIRNLLIPYNVWRHRGMVWFWIGNNHIESGH